MQIVLGEVRPNGRRGVAARSSRQFVEFYEQTWGELAGYASSLMGNTTQGADLAQEALARVYARWQLLRDPRPYAYRVVTNLAKDSWQKERRDREALALIDAGARSGEVAIDHGLRDAVRRLPPPLREVVMLHYYADLPVSDIARVTRRPAGTVKSRLFDARAALARNLRTQDDNAS